MESDFDTSNMLESVRAQFRISIPTHSQEYVTVLSWRRLFELSFAVVVVSVVARIWHIRYVITRPSPFCNNNEVAFSENILCYPPGIGTSHALPVSHTIMNILFLTTTDQTGLLPLSNGIHAVVQNTSFIRRLWPSVKVNDAIVDPAPLLSTPDCTSPPLPLAHLNTAGISSIRLNQEKTLLAVISHYSPPEVKNHRHAIELFQVSGRSEARLSVGWIGCLRLPGDNQTITPRQFSSIVIGKTEKKKLVFVVGASKAQPPRSESIAESILALLKQPYTESTNMIRETLNGYFDNVNDDVQTIEQNGGVWYSTLDRSNVNEKNTTMRSPWREVQNTNHETVIGTVLNSGWLYYATADGFVCRSRLVTDTERFCTSLALPSPARATSLIYWPHISHLAVLSTDNTEEYHLCKLFNARFSTSTTQCHVGWTLYLVDAKNMTSKKFKSSKDYPNVSIRTSMAVFDKSLVLASETSNDVIFITVL